MIDIPSDLIAAVQQRTLIPVVGAGVSMTLTDEAGNRIFPSWPELLERAAEEISRQPNGEKTSAAILAMVGVSDFKQAAKYARQGLQGTLWSQFFRKQFDEPLPRISEHSKELPNAIWGLGSRVLTLNYDKVLRGACPDTTGVCELDNTNKMELADFKRNSFSSPAIWHFHGRIDNMEKLIFTAESYDALYADKDPDLKAAIEIFKALCCDHRLLFVGCSLDDAELLHEMSAQHQLFAGNTGPHYALVRQADLELVRNKINALPISLLPFTEFGAPLVESVNNIARHAPAPSAARNLKTAQSEPQIVPLPSADNGKRIAILSASPLNAEQHYPGLLKEFRKINCPIDHFNLSIDNLNNLHGYECILILSKVIKDKVLIEDEYLCSRRISFSELEAQIGNDRTAGVFIFVDQLPDSPATAELRLPTLILADLDKRQLESLAYQLFKKNNLGYFTNSLVLNRSEFRLTPLNESSKGDIIHRTMSTTLPNNIDPKTVRSFIGRADDLEQICRKLLSLEEEGGVLTVKGSGGIGKTTAVKKIAVALAERGYFSGGITFVDCEPISDSQQFRYKVASAFNLEQAEDLGQYLRDHHDRQSRLIIIDNFETLLYLDDCQIVKDVLNLFCNYATISVTSRERLGIEGEVVYEMRQFTTDEAALLFRSCLEQREIDAGEIELLRQDILENLLDNNPLAIKLITGNMPKGKSLSALKEELETDLFGKISASELEVFDDSADLNIEKKRSIYGSILYSYRRLTDPEQRAFELLSLFPDGIDLETFKSLTREHRSQNKESTTPLPQAMITDAVIKALENKSMIENNSGQIRLQSIVGRFAEAQLARRDNLSAFFRNAFRLNFSLVIALREYRVDDKRASLQIFSSQQGNFLKCITYIDQQEIDHEDIVLFLNELGSFFVTICSGGTFIRTLTAKAGFFSGQARKCIETVLLWVQYYDGDFDAALTGILQQAPMAEIDTLARNSYIEQIMANRAYDIYGMEGEALLAARNAAKHNLMYTFSYPQPLLVIGEYSRALVEGCRASFFTFEALYNMGIANIAMIDDYLASLYEKDHLNRMQVSYTRAKLVPLEREVIAPLVIVNPYSRGLKNLMLAFVEQDKRRCNELYEEALDCLRHIKYYYVEALYLYAKFLQVHGTPEFDTLYRKGLDLAQRHNYRFLQYRFKQLLHPTRESYDPRNYPLPDGADFTGYIQFLIKEYSKRKGTKRPHRK